MNGLIIEVYRDAHGYDTTNNGISSKYDSLTLIGPGISGPFAPTPERPAVRMVVKNFAGDEYRSLVPCDDDGNLLPGWYMFGGNYAKTSDSRFPFKYPLPIHDRLEGTDQENARRAAYPAGQEFEPVKTGAQLRVGFFGRLNSDSKELGTGEWVQTFELYNAGQKIAGLLRENPDLYITGVQVADRFEFRPIKQGDK
jgi:hypothetical protein